MRICFTLDDVIRAKTLQICRIYKKYIDPDVKLDNLEIDNVSLAKTLGFKTAKEYMRFMYEDYPFEIFAEAKTCDKTLDKKFNLWMIDLEYQEEIEEGEVTVIMGNAMEMGNSIGNTCFFLSKIAPHIREFYFPTDSSELWDKCDVIVTATPSVIESKPEGKVCVKINMDYNTDCAADYEFDTLSDFLDEFKNPKKLLSNHDD